MASRKSFGVRGHVVEVDDRPEPAAVRVSTQPLHEAEIHLSHARSRSHTGSQTGKRNTMPLPKSYRTIEEFQREELRSHQKAGFSLDDLMQETMLHESDLLFDDQVDDLEPEDD